MAPNQSSQPLDGFALANLSGVCAEGIDLAKIKDVDVQVTGFTEPFLTSNITATA